MLWLSLNKPTAKAALLRREAVINLIVLAAFVLAGCGLQGGDRGSGSGQAPPASEVQGSGQGAVEPQNNAPTPFYTSRPRYAPGELVDYTAQAGDTLAGLALRFNTSVAEIQAANTFIPEDATSMPPGMPMRIPIYYLPLWGSPYQIIPDSQFVNGPSQVGFDTSAFVNDHPGWLKNYTTFVSEANRSGAEVVDLVALNYSLSPRLLLALLEYQSEALSNPVLISEAEDYPLGFQRWDRKGLFLQLAYAANQLNAAYYNHRAGKLLEIELKDGRLERIDPWQNAASAALHAFLIRWMIPKDITVRYHLKVWQQPIESYLEIPGKPKRISPAAWFSRHSSFHSSRVTSGR